MLPLQSGGSLNRVFSPCNTLLDFRIHIVDHALKVVNEVLLVLSCKLISFGVIFKFLLKKIIMSMLARPRIMASIWKQVIWTEANKVELANVWVVKMISHLQSHVQGIIAVLSHQLV